MSITAPRGARLARTLVVGAGAIRLRAREMKSGARRASSVLPRSSGRVDDDTTDFFAYDLRPRATTRAASPCVPSASSPSSARWPCSSPSRRRRSPRRPSPRSPTWPLCSRRARPRCARVVFFSLGPRTRISRFQPLSFVVVRAPLEAADGADRARPRPARASRATDGSAPRASRGVLTACLLYTSPSPRDQRGTRMPSSA